MTDKEKQVASDILLESEYPIQPLYEYLDRKASMTAKEIAAISSQVEGHYDGDVNSSWQTYFPEELEMLAAGALAGVREGGSLLEIGCFSGRSTSVLLQVATEKNAATILIDPMVWNPSYARPRLESVIKRFGNDRVVHTDFTSKEAHECVPDDYEWVPFDFIHIDGLHTPEAVELDCSLWLPHLRPGGVAAFHDYNHKSSYGHWVTEPVDRWTKGWEVLAEGGYWGLTVRRKPE